MNSHPFGSKLPYLLLGGAAAAGIAAVHILKRGGEHDYVRFENGNLETAIRRLEHPTKHVTIDLVGAIHVADKEYFESVKEHLDGLDQVLYEAVRPKEGEPSGHLLLLRRFYKILAGELDCAYQMEAIDYNNLPGHWEHCDMAEEEMASFGGLLYDEALTSSRLYGAVVRFATAQLDLLEKEVTAARGAPGGMFTPFKRMAAERLVNAMGNPLLRQIQMLVPDLLLGRGVILKARNKVVCDRLEEFTTHAEENLRIGVFYGAAHLPDIEQYLKDLGYEHRATFWQPAWDLD